MFDSRPRGRGIEPHLRHCVVVLEQDTFYPSLVLVQPRKTRPCLTERLLMERKDSNKTKLADNQDWHNILCFIISSWSLFQVKSYLPLSIINYGISKHFAGSQVSDRCRLDYLFHIAQMLIKPKDNKSKICFKGLLYFKAAKSHDFR